MKKYRLRELIKNKYGETPLRFQLGCQIVAQWLNGSNCQKRWLKEDIINLCALGKSSNYELPDKEMIALRILFGLFHTDELLNK